MTTGRTQQKILIVDDVKTNIKVLANAFREEYKISFATNGIDTLKIARSDAPPDLILLDVMLPDMDGYEVCNALKNDSRTQNIPVIFVTAKCHEDDETKGLEVGAVDYISKPFKLPIVKARVRTHLELKRHRDTLENLSTLDGLTGIPNRRYFDDYLQKEWNRALRQQHQLSLIMMDIDYFKAYNDNYGHIAGDDCLKRVAGSLSQSLRRASEFVARYGGEEFAAILPQTELTVACGLAQNMLDEVRGLKITHEHGMKEGIVTISLGLATTVPTRTSSPEVLISAADKFLYQAKQAGRNRMVADVLILEDAGV